jgi:hypothetical protein
MCWLIALTGIFGGGMGDRDRLGQAPAGRQRPATRHRQSGLHEHVIVRHTSPRFSDCGVRGIGLTQLGVCFGQREAARGP